MVTATNQERFRTEQGVFDTFTERTLFKLKSQGHFDEIIGPLSVGKESNVFIAKKAQKQVIVKIYRMQNCDFHKMYEYIRQDKRYEFIKKQKRFIILAWAQREFKNLHIAKKSGIKSPEVYAWKNHIIVEELIGDPAPPLKDKAPTNPQDFFKKTVTSIEKLLKQGLIHGDLSAFNILNHDEEPYFIDFSQATTIKAYNWEELLLRDLKNICQYFKKTGIKADPQEIFKKLVPE